MNTYTQKIKSTDADKIKQLFTQKNATFDVVQYANWRAKTPIWQAVYYSSGKLLIQGKNITDIANEVNAILGIENQQNTLLDNSTRISSSACECSTICESKYIGTDESGKGDFFGALVIAGVQVDEKNKQKFIDLGIKDSKKLDDKKILQFANIIKANAVHSVVVINPLKYNELYNKFNNLNKLLAWGHARAIENILTKSPCKLALADKFGDEKLIQNALLNEGKNIELKQMVRAESDIAVAAASVLARAEFVKRIQDMENKFELSFPKGASQHVKDCANIFISKYSFDRLKEVAKMHFKTANELTK